MLDEEMLYLVDENDTVLGSQPRKTDSKGNWKNFRVINAFVQNSKGELWIPRRCVHKRLFPLALDVSVGGHVTFGDSYEQTLLKETAEEINWDLKDYRYELLGYLNPYDHEELSAFMKVYLIRSDLVPNYNTNDFVEYFWLKPEELLAKIAAGEPAKGDLALLVRLFFC
jgi:isopentenyl-diphosphate delta-isomerase